MPKKKSPLELAARALCRHDRLPENITHERKPMWQHFIPQAMAVLEALGIEPEDPIP